MQSTDGTYDRGSNLLGVGQYNERLVLQLIRRAGSLPKADIARMTHLSAQTVSVIINRLLKKKLVHKQPLQRTRGKVGQPAIPIALNPEGAFSIGVKIGRSSLDILLIDFVGNVLNQASHHYQFPEPDAIFGRINEDINCFLGEMSATQRGRIVGIGVAAPFDLSGWRQLVGAPQAVLDRWNEIDIRQRIMEDQCLPVWFSNDATAACIAELEFSKQIRWKDFLYIFVGTFIGGGVVQNGTLNVGGSGNAGAIGSMLIPSIYSGEDSVSGLEAVQLIHCASRYLLNNQLKQAGFDPDEMLAALGGNDSAQVAEEALEIVDNWLTKSAEAIAVAIVNAVSVIDFRGVVIDGLLPEKLVRHLASQVEESIRLKNMEGLVCPEVASGVLGNDARALGGAVLPIYNLFTPDMNVLLNL